MARPTMASSPATRDRPHMSSAKIHSAGELLASIPALLGFVPHDSLVVVALVRGSRLGVMVRVDRADCQVREVAVELAHAIASQVERDGARDALVVSYTDAITGERDQALDNVVHGLRRRVRVRDAWVVASDRYRSQCCEDEACCPARGFALPLPPTSVTSLVASATGWGRSEARPSSLGADARRRVARARSRALAARERDESLWRVKRFGEWQAAVQEALDGRMPSDAFAGRMLAGFEDTRVRDAIVVSLHSRYAGVAETVIQGGDAPGVRTVLAGLVRGERTPDPASIEAAIDLSMFLSRAACGPRATRGCAGPLTVAAIGQWWLGDTRLAAQLLDTAIAAEPSYRLAQLAAATIAAGLNPGSGGTRLGGLGHLRP